MKIKKISFAIFVTILLSNFAFAQNKNHSLNNTLLEFKQAMLDSDTSKLSALTEAQLTYGHSTGKLQDKREFLQSFASGATDFVKINIEDEQIQYSGDVAVVHHILSADTNDNKKPGHTDLKILLVWKLEKKNWKLITRQAVKFK